MTEPLAAAEIRQSLRDMDVKNRADHEEIQRELAGIYRELGALSEAVSTLKTLHLSTKRAATTTALGTGGAAGALFFAVAEVFKYLIKTSTTP